MLYSLCSLTNCADGDYPGAGLTFDGAGNIYGTASGGGADGAGIVFKLTPNTDGSWTESVLHSFHGSDGAFPQAGLIFDAEGNLYGTTYRGGGADNVGAVFKLTPNTHGSWTESVLHAFSGSDGAYPSAGLIFDAAGNLYSTTIDGGADDAGTVFKLTPNADGSWRESVLHSFNFSDGAAVDAGLIFDGAGNLYGTAEGGGTGDAGTVFKLTSNAEGSWRESVLHRFQGKPAQTPNGGLVLGSTGTLYGTAARCFTGCAGVVYQITP